MPMLGAIWACLAHSSGASPHLCRMEAQLWLGIAASSAVGVQTPSTCPAAGLRGFAHVFDGVNGSSSQGYKVPVWFAKEFL